MPSKLLTLTLAGAALALALGARPAPAEARPLITGVSGLDDFSDLSFQRTQRARAKLVHVWISMADVSPDAEPSSWQPGNPGDGHYDWSSVDLPVLGAARAGLVPILGLYGVPPWAQACRSPDYARRAPCKPDPTKLADFARAAALRYNGSFGGLPRVRYWQVLNEPNLSSYFNPQFEHGRPVSAELYRKVINAAYVGIKSVHRSNLVLLAGLGPISVPRYTIGPMKFTRELLCMEGRRNPKPTREDCEGGVRFDIFDIHPYTTGGPNHKGKVDDVQLGDLAKLQELIAAADRAGRIKGRFKHTPLWITEFSWDSRPPDPGGLRMRILRRWTAEAMFKAHRAGIDRFFWFSLRDFRRAPSAPFTETIESGLYFRGATVAEGQPKPHLYAFRFPFVAYSRPSGFYFWGRTPTSRGGRVLIQVRQGGGWRNAEVVRADRHGIFDGMAKGGYGRKKRGTVRAVYRRERSVPFSLKPVKDFYQPPFGKPVPE